ncbi:MAG TPA: Xaa-Pro peptidase family protein [Dissulfurispiraceae bacterium]|nr:Xaa-Pro peptidase family protein [Dissulfurispiraceae bacterium]
MQKRLAEKQLEGAVIVHPADIYYFAGTRQNSAIWIPAAGSPTIFVRKSLARASAECALDDVRPFPSKGDLVTQIGPAVRRIGMTFDIMPAQYYFFYQLALPGIEIADVSLLVREVRSVKSPWELDRLRESGRMLAACLLEIPRFLRRGMRELDLAAEFEYRLKKIGNEGAIRMRAFGQELIGMVSSGAQAAAPGVFDGPVTGCGLSSSAPCGPSAAIIAENSPIIVDYSMTHDGYIVDMTRIFVFGHLSPELEAAFRVALDIQHRISDMLRPGGSGEQIYRQALEMAGRAGLGSHFMGIAGEQARFVGHGVGLELDEFPVLAKGFGSPLQTGQVVAVEPKFSFKGTGVVGIENTYAVTESGGELLTVLADDIVYL